MPKSILLVAALSALVGHAALAGHANPWAGEDDDLDMVYHDENLEQSIDTPGEDEMRGAMVQGAFGKLGGDRPGMGGPGIGGLGPGGAGIGGADADGGGGPGGGHGGQGGRR